MQIPVSDSLLDCHLTRARPGVWATFARPGGEAHKCPPPPQLTRKLRNASTSLCEVKIEVTRGHQGQNFPKFPNYMTWLHIIRIISVPVTATSKFKKAIESSWYALSQEWRQISPKINSLGVRGHERSKTAFLSEKDFSMITSVFEMIDQLFWRHRVFLVQTHRNMYSMTLKGQGQNLTSGQAHVVTK